MKNKNYLKIILLTALMVITCGFANAQKFSIKGRIVAVGVAESANGNTANAAKKGAGDIEDNKTVETKNTIDEKQNNKLTALKKAEEFADVIMNKKDMSVVTGCATDKNG